MKNNGKFVAFFKLPTKLKLECPMCGLDIVTFTNGYLEEKSYDATKALKIILNRLREYKYNRVDEYEISCLQDIAKKALKQ